VSRRGRAVGALTAIVLVAGFVTLPSLGADPLTGAKAHHLRRGFRNLDPAYRYSLFDRAWRGLLRSVDGRPAAARALVSLRNDGAALRANGTAPTVTWIGHATLLVQIQGFNILTDPHWSERASPVEFAGPRRLVAPGIRFEDLPPIHLVLISHDHYDHLDEETVVRLANVHDPTFFVPLGVKAWLADLGITQVVELDWWEEAPYGALRIACTPAQHSSGRGVHDQNLRLWSSWVVLGADRRFFFAGDTGYFPGFAEIGQRYGPLDLAAIPIGGYSSWESGHPNHVNPEEAVQAFQDVRGRLLAPVHWGTFTMNREPVDEPPERLLAEALRRGLEERIAPLSPGQSIHW
jgi:N-acyl-phosphatidylethanolamine-hydrolysing phospholipase D